MTVGAAVTESRMTVLSMLSIPLLVLIAVIMVISVVCVEDSSAETFDDGNFTYEIISDTASEHYVSVGKKTDTISGDITIPSLVTYNSIFYTVTKIRDSGFAGCTQITSVTINEIYYGSDMLQIGSGAFSGCSSLTEISIPKTVSSIGDNVFRECDSLQSITVDDDNAAYSSQDGVFYDEGKTYLLWYPVKKTDISYTLPDTVTHIVDDALCDCTYLQSIVVNDANTEFCSDNGVLFTKDKSELSQYPAGKTDNIYTVPSDVTFIFDYAFGRCSNLEKVVMSSVEIIGDRSFENCINLGIVTASGSLVTIGDAAFSGCSSLTSFTGADNLETVGSNAFYGCSLLVWEEFSNTLVTIGDAAFSGCSSFVLTELPSSLTAIGSEAFCNCTSIVSVTVHGGISVLNERTFSGCSSLSSISLPDTLTSIKDGVFSGCSSLPSINIPDTVTEIGMSAFESCTSLVSVDIPSGLTSFGEKAFSGCTSLTSVSVPAGITTIGAETFNGCISLSSVTISHGVRVIDNKAFSGCTSITEISIPASVNIIRNSVFFGCSSLMYIEFGGDVSTIETNAFSLGNSGNEVICYARGCSEGMLDSYRGSFTTFVYGTFYVIRYDSNGGSENIPMEITTDPQYTLRSSAGTKDGYTLNAWVSDSVLYVPGGLYTIESDMEFVADWMATEYAIDYDLKGGTKSGEFPTLATYDVFIVISNPTRVGYDFAGWTATGISHTAKYSDGEWRTWDGTLINKMAFINLNCESGKVSMEAHWTAKTYTVQYDTNGGTGTVGPGTTEAEIDGTFTLPSLIDAYLLGYSFTGWSYDKQAVYTNPTGKFTEELVLQTVEGVLTMYAMWSPITYHISYDLAGGSYPGIPPGSALYNGTVVLTEPTKCGFRFIGWSSTDHGSNAEYLSGTEWIQWDGSVVEGADQFRGLSDTQGSFVTMVANWDYITYVIEYDKNGGTGTVSGGTVTAKLGGEFKFPDHVDLKKIGMTFDGWSYNRVEKYENTTGKLTEELINAATGTTITLYSFWSPNKYYVKMECISPSEKEGYTEIKEVDGGFSFTIHPEGIITYSDYYHDAGSVLFDGDQFIVGFLYDKFTYSSSVVESEVTESCEMDTPIGKIYAVQISIIKLYQMGYSLNGGTGTTVGGTDTAVIGDPLELPNLIDAKKKGYEFLGWSIDEVTVYENETGKLTQELADLASGHLIMFYALWIRICNIAVDPDGASAVTVSSEWKYQESTGYYVRDVHIGTSVSDIGITFYKETSEHKIYTHNGWQYADGTSVTFPITVVSDLMIFPAYKITPESFNITYLWDTKEIYEVVTADYGSVIEPIPGPKHEPAEKYEYVFTSWGGYTQGMKVLGDTTFIAQYERTPILPDGKYISVDASDSDHLRFSDKNINELVERAMKDDAMLTVYLSNGHVVFSRAAILSLKGGADLSITKVDPSTLPQSVRDKIGDAPVYEVSFGINSNFGNGKVSVTLPYTSDHQTDLKAYYIHDGGIMGKTDCTYNYGTVTYEVNHFSQYAIVYEKEEKKVNVDAGLLIGGIVGSMAVILVAAFLILRRR